MKNRSFAGRSLRTATLAFTLVLGLLVRGQAIGDFGTIASGSWTGTTTWGIWNGAIFSPTASIPTSATNVWVRNGHTVTLPVLGSPHACLNLTVQAGGKLWTVNNPGNIYLSVFGSVLQCDGVIGDGNNFDGISFNMDGISTTIQGTGAFDCSRMRKNTNAPNATTSVIIAMGMNIRFAGGSTTQIYNNTGNSSFFNVTVNSGVTVNLVGTSGTGNLAIDGTNGATAGNAGGAYVVNGTINMNGILYLTSNNTANACSVTINNGGLIRCNQINAAASGAGGHSLVINNGGRLEVQGTPTNWVVAPSNTNNTYTLATGSTFEYSGLGPQSVWCGIGGNYGGLKISGSGTKSMDNNIIVRGNLDIVNTSGAPNLDCTLGSFNVTLAGNWSNYASTGFNERFGLVNFNGTSAQSITTSGGERYYNMRLSKGAATILSMNSDVSVGSVLNFTNGVLDLNQHRLTLENGAIGAITGGTAARYIISEQFNNSSKVQWNIGTNLGAHLIPFGRSGGYLPFTFDLTLGDAGNVTVSTYGTPAADNLPWPTAPTPVLNLNSTTGLVPDNSAATVDRFWQIDATGTPTSTYTFTYLASELPTTPYNTPTAMIGQWYNAVTNKWQWPLPSQTSTTYSVTVPGATQLGPWALAAVASPLPIELISFTAKRDGPMVDLEWSTASEQDNDHFTIFRSADGSSWTEVLRRAGALNSQHRIDYSDIDPRPLNGLNFYKLRQTDVDGQWTESDVVLVNMGGFNTQTGKPYPVPASDRLNIPLPEGSSVLGLELLDPMGRVLRTLSTTTAGTVAAALVSDIPAGSYVVRIRTDLGEQSWPVVIVH